MKAEYYVPKEDKKIFFKSKSGKMKQIKQVFFNKSYNERSTMTELIIFFYKPQSMKDDDTIIIEKFDHGVGKPYYILKNIRDTEFRKREIILEKNTFSSNVKFNTTPINLFSFFVDGNVDNYYRKDYFDESDGSTGPIRGGTKRKYRINSGKKHRKSIKKNIKRRKSKKRKTRGK